MRPPIEEYLSKVKLWTTIAGRCNATSITNLCNYALELERENAELKAELEKSQSSVHDMIAKFKKGG